MSPGRIAAATHAVHLCWRGVGRVGGGRREEGREVETRDENGGKGKGGREKGERWGKREILYI